MLNRRTIAGLMGWVALLLCVVLLVAGGVGAQGRAAARKTQAPDTPDAGGEEVVVAQADEQTPEPKQEEPPRELINRTRGVAWRLTHKAGRGQIDVFYLVQKAFDLDDDRAQTVKKLEEEFQKDDRNCREKECLRKLRRLLSKQRAETMDAVLGHLEDLQKAQRTDAREFLKEADPKARKKAEADGGTINTSDLTRYLDLPDPMRKQLDRLNKEMYERVQKHMASSEPPDDLEAKEQRRWKVREHRKAREQAWAWYEGQRDALLNQHQLKRLRQVEKAAESYKQSLRKAHRECAAAVQEVLLVHAGYEPPQED